MVLKLSQLVYRSMLKNMKSYYLYFFSLIFSVTLYFSFKTLRYNDEVTNQLKDGSSASMGFEVATYLLYFIILIFVLYANKIFMNRRSKEIGLYQLIGMSKGLIFRLIAIENMVLFGGAVIIGIAIGFLISRLFAMILLKIIGSNYVLGISFSVQSAVLTLAIFAVMLIIILIQLYFIIRKHTLLEMFQAANKADESVRSFSVVHMLLGLSGLGLIIYGYYASTVLFDGPGSGLVFRMLTVLGTTILGTYLIFRFSVALIINVWRRTRKGFLSRSDVVALSPIMHRMKSSASSLTLIAVLTAVSLGINTLAYISYFTIEKTTVNMIPAHFVIKNEMLNEEVSAEQKLKAFEELLKSNNIEYDVVAYKYTNVYADFKELLVNRSDGEQVGYDIIPNARVIAASNAGKELKREEMVVTNFNTYTTQLCPFGLNKTLSLPDYNETLTVVEYEEKSLLTNRRQLTLYPVIIVSDEMYKKIVKQQNENSESSIDIEDLQARFVEYHINLKDNDFLELAETLYAESGANVEYVVGGDLNVYQDSQYGLMKSQLESLGLTIFITAFLGLVFLLASGSILYFKQMTEADMESGSYTVLRKIGYSEQDLMHGVYRKQLFNFGVPIIVGLCHSYFAVKSGWWFFGTEYATPMVIMMIIYILLYTVFAFMTIRYYRRVAHKAL